MKPTNAKNTVNKLLYLQKDVTFWEESRGHYTGFSEFKEMDIFYKEQQKQLTKLKNRIINLLCQLP